MQNNHRQQPQQQQQKYQQRQGKGKSTTMFGAKFCRSRRKFKWQLDFLMPITAATLTFYHTLFAPRWR